MSHIRFAAAACQTDMPNPIDRHSMRANTDRMLSMIDSAVAGTAPFLPVKLIVFPEFAHAAPIYPTVQELLAKLAVEIPNEHTERLTAKACTAGPSCVRCPPLAMLTFAAPDGSDSKQVSVTRREPGTVFDQTHATAPSPIRTAAPRQR